MPGLLDFTRKTFSPRVFTTAAANYTALATDDEIDVSGAYTVTLPPINGFQGLPVSNKMYKIKNVGTSNVTIQPGTNTITNVADTVASKAVWTLFPNEYVIIEAQETYTDWAIIDPISMPGLGRVPFAVSVNTSGTAAVNVFDANGAPVNLDITEILTNSQDTTAANVTVTNGASTVATIAKSTTAGVVVGATTISYSAVAAGSTLTVTSSSAGVARVTLIGTTQTVLVTG